MQPLTENLDEVLQRIAEEVFETLAFLYPLPEPGESDPTGQGGRQRGSVKFSGLRRGQVRIELDKAMLPVLAANMLGLEVGQQVDIGQQRDALKELANVLCGNLLPVLLSEREVFDVQEPVWEMLEAAAEASETAPPLAQAHLCLDAGGADVQLFLEPLTDAD